MLLFAYFYPPLSGAGVQRPIKMIKYLHKHGWEVDVVTVKDLMFHSYDKKLLAESRATAVVRTASLDLMYFLGKTKSEAKNKIYFKTPELIKNLIRQAFPLDEKIGWNVMAFTKAKQLVRQKKYDCVMVTMGPFSSGIAAYKIGKFADLPLIVDFRDHWTLHPYISFLTPLHKKLAKIWEKKYLKKARIVTTASKTMAAELIKHYRDVDRKKFVVMYNGYDEDDFSQVDVAEPKNKVIEFVYTGNFYGLQSVKHLCSALKIMITKDMLPEDVRFTFIGNYYRETLAELQAPELQKWIKIIPQIPHEEVIPKILQSDALLLFIASYRGRGIIPGKLMEYMRSQKPILAMIPPEGEAADILRQNGHEYICPMEAENEIIELLMNMYENIKSGAIKRYEFNDYYSREGQTNKLIDKLSDLSIPDKGQK
jgi:glycosyltransferase involved in cell wall biosynthesis